MPASNLTRRKPRILVLEGLHGAARCVTRAGGEPICVSPRNIDAVDEALAQPFDGLLLTGGGDVDPRLYGEKPHKQVYGVNETRDYTEWCALDRAAELDVPVFGICRGMQLMTVHNGGALKQHVTGHRGMDHLVFGESGSRFRRIIRGERGYFVSLHHQVVRRTGGNGWRVAARARGGTIEAVESKDGRCLGVQFHPEMDYGSNEASRHLFSWLTGEAAKRAGLVKPRRQRAAAQAPRQRAPRTVAQRDRSRQQRLDLETATGGRRKPKTPVKVSWFCPHCAMQFDRSQDREDHIFWLHGDDSLWKRWPVAEPPPGHPDWM